MSRDDLKAHIETLEKSYEFFLSYAALGETKAVAAYYKVLNNMLSVFDLEKLYIPPQLNESEGLYGNQLLCEQAVLKELNLNPPETSHLLDMGCGRGRVAHYLATNKRYHLDNNR